MNISIQDCLIAALIICAATTFFSAILLFKDRTQGWVSALGTYPAWLYIAIRTILGGCLLWLAHWTNLEDLHVKSEEGFVHVFTTTHLLYGIVAGVLPVYFLRTLAKAFPVKANEPTEEEEGFRKFIEMLLDLESHTVESIGVKITLSRIKNVRKTLPNDVSFLELCEDVRTGLHAFDHRQAAKVQELRKEINDLIHLYDSEKLYTNNDADVIDKNYSAKLAYAIMNTFDSKTYRLLMTAQEKTHP